MKILLPCGKVALALAVEALLQTSVHQLVLTPSLAAVVVSVLYGGLDELESIFEKGKRGRNVALSDGLGFGLWLAKSITELHEGDIEVSSVEGKGSTFSVRLPLAEIRQGIEKLRAMQRS
jgi:K+-sensing histidine kinase KdpD